MRVIVTVVQSGQTPRSSPSVINPYAWMVFSMNLVSLHGLSGTCITRDPSVIGLSTVTGNVSKSTKIIIIVDTLE